MASQNRLINLASKRESRINTTSLSLNAERKLLLNKHNSFNDLEEYYSEMKPELVRELISILKADEMVNKNLKAFLYLCATGEEQALIDFNKLNLQELGISQDSLFDEIAHSFEGYLILNNIKLKISDYNGELFTAEIKDMRTLLHSHEIGQRFKQNAISSLDTAPLTNNVINMFK